MRTRNFKAQYWAIFWSLIGLAAIAVELTTSSRMALVIAAFVCGFCTAPALYYIRKI